MIPLPTRSLLLPGHQRYLLLVQWEKLSDHTEGFRGWALFQQWRAVIGPFFDGAPAVEHYEEALTDSRL